MAVPRVSTYSVKRAKGLSWGIRWRIDGKDFKEIIGTSKKQAEQAAIVKQNQIFEGKLGIKKDEIIDLATLTKEFTDSKRNISASTKSRYTNYFVAFQSFMDEHFPRATKNIRDIKRVYVEEFSNHKVDTDKWAPKTINGALAAINSMFLYAVNEQYLEKSPTKSIEKFQLLENTEAKYFTKDELELVWKNVNPYWGNFLKVLYYTGVRKGELINLTWRNVSIEGDLKYITIISTKEYKTKTGEKRTVPLHPKAVSIIKKQRGIHNKYVFPSQEGNKIHPDKPYRALKKALKKAKLDGTVHKLRHTFASHLVMAGESLYAVKELLGHKDIKHTMIYAHLSPNTQQAVVSKLYDF
jgi:integrase